MLPADVQGPIGTGPEQVTGIVGTIVPSVLATVTGLIDTILGSLPFVGGTSAAAGGAFGLGGLLGGILGGGAHDRPGVGDIGSMHQRPARRPPRRRQRQRSGPGRRPGIGGIIGTVTGLINIAARRPPRRRGPGSRHMNHSGGPVGQLDALGHG